MRRLGRLGLCFAVLASTATALAAPTHTTAPPKLLTRFAPVIVLSRGEAFAPEKVDGFIADSTLTAAGYDQSACQAVGGPAAEQCYIAADGGHAEPPSVYGAVFKAGGRTVLEYWFFYYFDLYRFADPIGSVWQDHESDWEAVAVVLDAKSMPLFVATSRHCSGARRGWANVRRRGNHPVIYVARGSHANYFGPGIKLIPNQCLPPQARALLDQYHVRLPDVVPAGRTIANEGVVPITATWPSWMTFTGPWGEAQYVKIPNQAPFAYGTSPTGPASHDLWRRPLTTVLGWPRG